MLNVFLDVQLSTSSHYWLHKSSNIIFCWNYQQLSLSSKQFSASWQLVC